MSNNTTLPFGFTACTDENWLPLDEMMSTQIHYCADGLMRSHCVYGNGTLSTELDKNGMLDGSSILGYFNATSAQLAALPELLEMVKQLQHARIKDLRDFKADAAEIMRKIGG